MAGDDLKGIIQVKDASMSDQIEANLISLFDWGLLNRGGFTNITVPTSGTYGGDKSRLRPVKDPAFTDGKVWEGYKYNWAWESGLNNAIQPIQVSGVFVNSTFHPLGEAGNYNFYVDYPRGRIVFNNSGLPTTSIVQCSFSPKWCHVTIAESPQARIAIDEVYRVDKPEYLAFGSGDWNILSYNRATYPLLAVEVVPNSNFTGLELGGGQIQFQDVLFHIFAQTRQERNKLFDIVQEQNDLHFFMYDLNRIADYNAYPLDAYGSIASGAKTFPQLLAPTGDGGYRWRMVYIDKMRAQVNEQTNLNLFHALIRATLEIWRPDI